MSAFPAVSAEPVLQVERGSKRSERIATPARHWRHQPQPLGKAVVPVWKVRAAWSLAVSVAPHVLSPRPGQSPRSHSSLSSPPLPILVFYL